jgi:hypothetical protein
MSRKTHDRIVASAALIGPIWTAIMGLLMVATVLSPDLPIDAKLHTGFAAGVCLSALSYMLRQQYLEPRRRARAIEQDRH